MNGMVLALDQGTTSSRALLFDSQLNLVAQEQRAFESYYPQSGWVEQEPKDLWKTTLDSATSVLKSSGITAQALSAIGIANQRETTLLWDRQSGKPLHRALVWQDRRTADLCDRLRAEGYEAAVSERSGLRLDPYFSASKLAWLLEHVEGARAKAEAGKLAFGTVDSWLIWKLTGGQRHVTDITNAARTALFNIHDQRWDEALLDLFDIPAALLPQVLPNQADFGSCLAEHLGAAVPILGVAGDQQAASIGQACFSPGMTKATYGTGAFVLMNSGESAIASQNRMLTTIAYQIGEQLHYALEGAVFIAGAAVQWLRDGLQLIASAEESGSLAATADPGQRVTLVPAFTGLGAPYWDSDARGALFGLTRNSGPAEIARATLESIAFQSQDLLSAMSEDAAAQGLARIGPQLRVDGGLSASDWTMQKLADITRLRVERPALTETTALGAAYLAALGAGLAPAPEAWASRWQRAAAYHPRMDEASRSAALNRWQDAVARTRSQQRQQPPAAQ